MKCTRSGHKWAHVSCALWIPEVSIGSVERMEPITKISAIPVSRLSHQEFLKYNYNLQFSAQKILILECIYIA